ncbi:MAG: hypothetical protein JSS87_04040 [Acidobacteria bacterium]|nr:hypothetical protein [Acidobacteriota bacterium]
MFEEEKSSNTSIVVSIVVLVVLAAAGAVWFLLKNNHPDVEAAVTQVELMPLHSQYEHVYGNAGADQTEDNTYVLAHVIVNNRNSAAPAFLKDFSATLIPKEGEGQAATALEKDDLATVLKAFSQMQPLTEKVGGKPLLRETEIPRSSSAQGYVVFLFHGTPAVWKERTSATLRVDLYHNGVVTTEFPK